MIQPDRTYSAIRFRLREVLRQMWVRVTLFSAAGVALALITPTLEPLIPYEPSFELASGAVDEILQIIASSMLAVTTFSMSIIVGAYGGTTSNATPRANELLQRDPAAQNAISIFIGSFLFSIVGIIGLHAGVYRDSGRLLLFFATLIVIMMIAWALLRWLDHLNEFGLVKDVVTRIEEVATKSALAARAEPRLGARPLPSPLPADAPGLGSRENGYVRHLDIAALQDAAEQGDLILEVMRPVGRYVHQAEPLLRLSRLPEPALANALYSAFSIGPSRSYEQDVEYGLTVLSEVATRALPPEHSDPGTAIDVLRAGTRVLLALHGPDENGAPPAPAEARHDRVYAPGIDLKKLYKVLFVPIARHGAGVIEVQETLFDSLEALAERGGAEAAQIMGADARSRARAELTEDWERAEIG